MAIPCCAAWATTPMPLFQLSSNSIPPDLAEVANSITPCLLPSLEIVTNPFQLWTVSRARLHTLNQSQLYHHLNKMSPTPYQRSTTVNMAKAQHAIAEYNNHFPEPQVLWKAIWPPTFRCKHKDFLWKSMHDVYKIGDFWLHTQFTECAYCPQCPNFMESMEHILTDCTDGPQSVAWGQAKKLWTQKTNIRWPAVSFGTILGCRAIHFPKHNSSHRLGLERFYKILITESAHLIWVIRCEHLFGREDRLPGHNPTTKEIQARWAKLLNICFNLDRAITRTQMGEQALPYKPYLDTWEGTFANSNSLPEDWAYFKGVLVGISPVSNYWPNPP